MNKNADLHLLKSLFASQGRYVSNSKEGRAIDPVVVNMAVVR